MMNVLLVADDSSIREQIETIMPRNPDGIAVCREVRNGLEALATIADGEPPDLIVADLRTAEQQSLDWLPAIQQALPQAEVIAYTGYIDLPAMVLAAMRKWHASREAQSTLKEIRHKWERCLPDVIEQSLRRWVRRPGSALENRAGQLAEWQSPIRPAQLMAGIIRIDKYGGRAWNPGDQELLRYAAWNVIQETLRPAFDGRVVVVRDGNDFIWISNMPHPAMTVSETKQMLQELKHNLGHYVKLSVSIGAGERVERIEDIQHSYEQALKAVEMRFYSGNGTIALYSELDRRIRQQASSRHLFEDPSILEIEQRILGRLRTLQYEETIACVDQWLQLLRMKCHIDHSEVRLRTTAFILDIQRLASSLKLSSARWNRQLIDCLNQIVSMETLEDLAATVKRLIGTIASSSSQGMPSSSHRTIRNAIAVIHAKYNTNLTLESVAKEVYVSTTYLSALFKQELGVNFLDYLHQYRIEHAKPLLGQNYKLYAVARMVGYQEERYFSRTFKKWTGLTPTEFRNQFGFNG